MFPLRNHLPLEEHRKLIATSQSLEARFDFDPLVGIQDLEGAEHSIVSLNHTSTWSPSVELQNPWSLPSPSPLQRYQHCVKGPSQKRLDCLLNLGPTAESGLLKKLPSSNPRQIQTMDWACEKIGPFSLVWRLEALPQKLTRLCPLQPMLLQPALAQHALLSENLNSN